MFKMAANKEFVKGIVAVLGVVYVGMTGYNVGHKAGYNKGFEDADKKFAKLVLDELKASLDKRKGA
jgi:hypothetical protein